MTYGPSDVRLNAARFARICRVQYAWRDDQAADDIRLLTWAIIRLLRQTGNIGEDTTRMIQRVDYRTYYDALDQSAVKECLRLVRRLGAVCLTPRKDLGK